ncbi:MAG TPA: amino acid ABC transporter substrate-binding protein [Burkholderiales bacterium]|nr:amino acid ABC transporter substrate-binding protein [Burkholderiales bacterium]HUK04910.1 amino acid ABC transporter substrate-binding protein [Burkholderiales bacterium]
MTRQILVAAAAMLVALSAFAADEDTLTIGYTVSRTGALNLDSLAQERGFEMWRDEVNAAGGIKAGAKHYKVRFVSYDDQSQGGRVQQLYTRLIVQDHAQFLFSPYSSGLVATATVISEQYGKLMMSIGGAEGKTYQLGNHYLFQTYTPADQYLSGAIALLKEKNPHAKIALVYSDDPFSKAVASATREQAKQAGLSLVMDESYPPSQTDFSAIINKIVASGADALLGGGHYPDGATLARQLYDQKASLKWATLLVAPDSPQFASLGPAAQGISVPSQWAPQVTYKPDFGPTPAEFTKRFEAKYNIAPGYHAAGGYAGGMLFQHAIERAGSVEPDKVAAELNKMKATTLWGGTQFSTDPKSHGLQLSHQMVLTQWQMEGGKLVKEVVWPASAATAKVAFPYR